ncbi:uncharacterized protein [Panulirus ornatus]|uniref:uncharacterized protein n=1 Tax=Panulirus ornatus TaxID=150431 RepID=UPI003A8B95E3
MRTLLLAIFVVLAVHHTAASVQQQVQEEDSETIPVNERFWSSPFSLRKICKRIEKFLEDTELDLSSIEALIALLKAVCNIETRSNPMMMMDVPAEEGLWMGRQ